MKISKNWLNELIKIDNISNEELDKLISLNIIEIDAFEKIVDATNLVVGKVLEKVKHADADKLNVLQVDLGTHTDQIVCGAKNVDVDQHVIVALPGAVLPGNFKIKKSKVRGVESNGMVCSLSELGIAAKYQSEEDKEGIYVFKEEVAPGTDAIEALDMDDYMIELGLTPNRSDLLSHIGLARDLATVTGIEYSDLVPNVSEGPNTNDIKVNINTDKCTRYIARKVDVEIGESPQFIKSRLIACGVRPINNVVDITNYVMLELGQPLHAFDASLIEGNTINVSSNIEAEVVTLDGQTRKIINDDIIISDSNKPVAIAGVMGLANSEVTENTKSIVLESALFDKKCVRKTYKRLDLRSESSTRFEKGIDYNITRVAINRACELLTKYANGNVYSGVADVETSKFENKIVNTTLTRINSYLGTSISIEELNKIFTSLRYTFAESNGEYSIAIPSDRLDIENYQDIIEEVARIYGFNNIPVTIPRTSDIGKYSNNQKLRRKIEDNLLGSGLDQVITYSLLNENKVYKYSATEMPKVSLLMPMSEERSTLRQSLVNGLLEVASYNVARKTSNVSIFEMGKVYCEKGEQFRVSALITGNLLNKQWNSEALKADFFGLKGIVESLFDELNIEVSFAKAEVNENYHPGQSASVMINNEVIGFIAAIHPKTIAEYDLGDTFVFELNLTNILDVERTEIKYEQLPKFPGIKRDLSLICNNETEVGSIIDDIKKSGKKLLKDTEVFDLYRGERLGADHYSLGISLYFLDKEKTLETDEVEKRVATIIKNLENNLSVKLG